VVASVVVVDVGDRRRARDRRACPEIVAAMPAGALRANRSTAHVSLPRTLGPRGELM
jgi:hypothetical protein